jgi:uncharacterized RDD family membrane protein YckC
VDRRLEIQTPESVAFAHQLAGVGSRFLALAFDLFLQVLSVIAFLVILSLAVERSHFAPRTGLGESLALALVIFVLFAIFFGYFIAFEAFWNGQTLGKKLLGIRVVKDGGYPIDFAASLIRNVIRIGEQALGFYAISAICMLASTENKRFGDYAAGTIVVRETRVPAPSDVTPDSQAAPYAATALVSGEERELVHRFIERRGTLSPERRAALAATLAGRIRPRVGPELARLDDESLLERL